MKRKILVLVTLALVLAFSTSFALACANETGTFSNCYGLLPAQYGGDTFTSNNYYIHYWDKDMTVYKCMGVMHPGYTPPTESVTISGATAGYPYYYWDYTAVDWMFGWFNPQFGDPSGETMNWKVTVNPDGSWTLIAKTP